MASEVFQKRKSSGLAMNALTTIVRMTEANAKASSASMHGRRAGKAPAKEVASARMAKIPVSAEIRKAAAHRIAAAEPNNQGWRRSAVSAYQPRRNSPK